MNMNKREQKYWTMVLIVALVSIVIYAIHIVQYPAGFSTANIAEATVESLMVMGIMLFNYKIVSSYIVSIIAGIIGMIFKVGNSDLMLFFSFCGLLVMIIRILHNRNTGELVLPEKPIERIDYLLNIERLKPLNIDHIYRAMLIVLMATFVMNIKNGYTVGDSFGSPDLRASFIICIPLLIGFMYGFGLIDTLVLGFVAIGMETLVCLEYFMIEQDIVIMYQATIRLMLMFISAYSYMFGCTQFEEDLLNERK